uniref:Uncharacterized protein MANES_15G092300 n=2 Tax=Rhizophora mucronata TaxID=61149 RepID=A0A2P2KU63_RHIMU
MAAQALSTTLLLRPVSSTAPRTLISSLLSRTFSSLPTPSPSFSPRPSSLIRSALRILSSATAATGCSQSLSVRCFSTRATSSSLNDQNPNWSNRPPKETILLDGCDFEHWLVVVEKPEGDPTRDEIIDSYIKTLAMVVGSEEEARKKIYSVSTRCYFAFGALVSEELSYKIKELPRVRWVLPDSYLDVKNKDYGGEPFINGEAVPYHPKYHEEWIRNNAKANERNRRNDRPRNFDRSRNFERRRENMQNRDFQNREPAMANQGMQNPATNMGGIPQYSMGGPGGPSSPTSPPSNYMGGVSPNNMGRTAGPPSPPPPNSYMGGPSNNMGGMPLNNMRGMPNNMGGVPAANNMVGVPPANNMGGMPPNNMGGMPPNAGWSNNVPGNMQQNLPSGHNGGGIPYQGPPSNYQNGYNPNRDGSMPGGN